MANVTPILDLAVLGLACDPGAWPEAATGPLTDGAAAAGTPVLGPRGLLATVETALGLVAPETPAATRLAVWRAKLAGAGEGRFWSDSLAKDPLATAEVTLAWRDALLEAGWTPGAVAAPRLADLAAAEAAGETLPPGFADRIAAAVAALEGHAPIATLRLLDPREALPAGIARLVEALERCGTTIGAIEPPVSPALGDLGAVQGALRDGMGAKLAGDGSLALLTAETETAAAEVLADWLAAGGAQGRTVIVADRPTAALDAALARRNMPALGVSRASAQRGALQLLPLVLATRWAPFDAGRLLQLLQARPSPIPHELRHALTKALAEAPGRGGPQWRQAMEKGRARLAERLAAEEVEDSSRAAAPRIEKAEQRIALLLEAPLTDPEAGMSLDELRALCGLLIAWAAERGRGEDPLLLALGGAALALSEAAAALGRATLPRVELERLVAAALEPGLTDPLAMEQAAPWSLVRDPAALWGYADTVVWWGLGEPGLPPRLPWNRAERAALAEAGCAPAHPAARLAGLAHGWKRPLLHARRRALLVAVPDPATPDARRHPVLDELYQVLADAPPSVRPVAERLLADPAATLLGTTLPRVTLDEAALPQPRDAWTIPVDAVPPRAVESATSIERMLGCPFSWVAQYAAGLRPGWAAEVPEGARLVGLLAHQLAEEIFAPGAPPAPEVAKRAAEARLPSLLDEMGAPMLTPGAAAELARLRADLPGAMAALAELLAKRALVVEATETKHRAEDTPAKGQALEGRVDMLLRKPDGGRAVLDLKWARSARSRRAEIEEGRAVQLAAYVGLVGAGEDAAFFMLGQRRAVATSASVFGGQDSPGLRETWQDAIASIATRRATIASGTLLAPGVGWDEKKRPPNPDALPLLAQPPCRYCDAARLCGKEALR